MKGFFLVLFVLVSLAATAQSRREDIYSDYVLYAKRQRLERDLRENTIGKTFAQELTKDNEHRFESACWALAQFQFRNATVTEGLDKLLASYDSLEYDTKRAFLEAAYALYPERYLQGIGDLLQKETNPKLFAMCAVYRYRALPNTNERNAILIRMVEQFPDYDTLPLLAALEDHLNYSLERSKLALPNLKALSQHFRNLGLKVVFSFQRWNRDYPGMAVVQNADGSLVKRADGHPMVFEQLARSGSSLPYFLTNGNTPQGIYSITGTAVAHNNFIGPTPNLQLIMPYEDSTHKFFHHLDHPVTDTLGAYKALLPAAWKSYAPMLESYTAGKIGRTEIIAHGTTIDPEYFKDKPYYPLTPTLGCLCAKEIWNITSGRLLVSEQYNLYAAFTATPGVKGYLLVINLDDQQKAVSREEVEQLFR